MWQEGNYGPSKRKAAGGDLAGHAAPALGLAARLRAQSERHPSPAFLTEVLSPGWLPKSPGGPERNFLCHIYVFLSRVSRIAMQSVGAWAARAAGLVGVSSVLLPWKVTAVPLSVAPAGRNACCAATRRGAQRSLVAAADPAGRGQACSGRRVGGGVLLV